ncbi:hypothetical protein [Streptomyces sp. NPDC101776]|uniref:hypothetical protein n=1 Tax=Streptomyces sp. NPDC101776 TaxID=3366146 RepID=UPI0037F7FE33
MGKRKHVDLSNEEPTPRADPVMETLSIEVGPKRVVVGTSTHRDSHLGVSAASLTASTGVLGTAVGAGALAFWVGMGPVGCMVCAAVGAFVALVVVFFVFKAKTHGSGAAVDYTPETRPPVNKSGPKGKAGKKGKKRR